MIRDGLSNIGGMAMHGTTSARRDDGGNVTIFGLMLTVLMLMLGGIAVDVMRHEQVRTEVQQTLDRSVLAAASLTQTLPPEDVVADYFEKAGIARYLSGVTVDTTVENNRLYARSVTASAQTDLPTFFMDLNGQNTLAMTVTATAVERRSDVEVSLLLDTSSATKALTDTGFSKHHDMKLAAKAFVGDMVDQLGSDRVSITLLPMAGNINLGPRIFNYFTTVSDKNGIDGSYCLDLPTSAYVPDAVTGYVPTAVDFRSPAVQAGYMDSYTATPRMDSDGDGVADTAPLSSIYEQPVGQHLDASGLTDNAFCLAQPFAQTLAFANSRDALTTAIDDLEPAGRTSLPVGLKWATAFLDPAMRPIANGLIQANQVDSVLTGRPRDYGTDTAIKVIVVMSSGESYATETLAPGYRTGLAPIWTGISRGKTAYALYSASRQKYWMPDRGEWIDKDDLKDRLAGAVQLTWPQVWSRLRMQWVAWQLFSRWNPGDGTTVADRFTAYLDNLRTRVEAGPPVSATLDICAAAKARGIIIYTVAFGATDAGRALLQSCATSPDHAFVATGLDISDAFAAIRRNIVQLSLVQ
ncbi:MAG: hypothetical protein EBU97_00305 [Rhodobacteraceae bacterium]|nr:hypothetical protein [Paracoccaceae bacterium]